jgi:dTDP-4-dehydrorhamnose reductase
MRVLVTGGTGLLGWWVARVLAERGFHVTATYHVKKPSGIEGVSWLRMDLEDARSIGEVIRSVAPDVIVHTAAYTDVDGCEVNRSKAYRVNYLGTMMVAKLCKELGCFMVYVSTDYVFDGERGLYSEEDVPSPVNYYGLSKLLGEVAVESLLGASSSLILRVSGLYGYSPTGKRNFGIIALEKLLRGEEVKAFHDQYLSPTYTPFLAEMIARVIEKEVKGVLHIAGARVSRYQFALTMAKVLRRDPGLVKPISMSELRLPARRPRDSSLDTSRAQRLGMVMPSHEDAIQHFVAVYRQALEARAVREAF